MVMIYYWRSYQVYSVSLLCSKFELTCSVKNPDVIGLDFNNSVSKKPNKLVKSGLSFCCN